MGDKGNQPNLYKLGFLTDPFWSSSYLLSGR